MLEAFDPESDWKFLYPSDEGLDEELTAISRGRKGRGRAELGRGMMELRAFTEIPALYH
jgi:hypothetical protein